MFLPLILATLFVACIDNVRSVETAIAPVTNCTGQSIVMVAFINRKLGAASGATTVPNQTLRQCSDLCQSLSSCQGLDFAQSSATCIWYTSVNPTDALEFAGNTFLLKNCADTTNVCSAPFQLEATPGKMLVGFARAVQTTENAAACWKECFDALKTHGFECESLMYYLNSKECILNSETRYQRPDLFIDGSTDDPVVYIDNNCAQAQCLSPYKPQFIEVVDRVLTSIWQNNPRITNTSLINCQFFCTHKITVPGQRVFNCKSFMYEASTKTCVLADDKSKPLGRLELQEQTGVNYYELACFQAPAICPLAPAFTRVPQMILSGFAAYVMQNTPTLTACLDICVKPPVSLGADFKCLSVMYYYKESECILNTETRFTQPKLFNPDRNGFLVDYFDLSCGTADICPTGTTSHSLKIIDYMMPNGEDGADGTPINVQMTTTGGSEVACLQGCLNATTFICRAVDYTASTKTCEMSCMYRVSTGIEAAPGTNYIQPICITGLGICPNHTSAYTLQLKMMNTGTPVKTYPSPTSLMDCLGYCSAAAFSCYGANFNAQTAECQLFNTKGSTQTAAKYEYYEHNCLTEVPVDPQPRTVDPGTVTVTPICQMSGLAAQVNAQNSFSGAVFAQSKFESCRVDVASANAATLFLGYPTLGRRKRQTPYGPATAAPVGPQPGYVQPQATAAPIYGPGPAAPAPGVIPPISATPAPPALPKHDCGVVDKVNGTYCTDIVVQTNTMGIPGLVTAGDKVYTVCCDYSGVQGKAVQVSVGPLTVEGPNPSFIKPRGKIQLTSPVAMSMQNSPTSPAPTLMAKLGDPLQLQWEMMAEMDVDFLVRNCVASPLGGATSPSPAPSPSPNPYGGAVATPGTATAPASTPQMLQLIKDGCPTAAVQGTIMPGVIEKQSNMLKTATVIAFRFDGTKTVQVSCELELCKGTCNPYSCTINGTQQNSYGRKRRSIKDSEVFDIETDKYVVKSRSRATATITIVDHYPKHVDTPPSFVKMQEHKLDLPSRTEIFENAVPISKKGKFCLPKSIFLGVFLFLGSVVFAQVVAIGFYCVRRKAEKQL